MKNRIRILAIIIVSIIAIPSILNSFSDNSIVQSINNTPSGHIVYDEALSPNWENWSWNSDIQFDSGDSPFQGSKTMQWKSSNWGGLYLHVKNNESVDAAGYESLQISVKGTQDNHQLTFLLYDQNNQPIGGERTINDFGGGIINGQWKTYTFPMSTLNSNNLPVKGIVLQSKSDSEQRLFVDEIRFVPKPTAAALQIQTGTSPIYTDTLDSNWENWSWDSSVVLDENFKTHSGSRAIAFTSHAPWAGLYLHAKQAVNTSAYSALQLAIFASQPNQEFAVTMLGEHNSITQNPQQLSKFGGPIKSNEWTMYTIPLSAIGANAKNVTGLIIQNTKNSGQPIVYLDSIAFVSAGTESTNQPTGTIPSVSLTKTSTLTATPQPVTSTLTSGSNPFASTRMYVNPDNNAKRTMDQWRSQGRTAEADALTKISDAPTAFWAVGDNSPQSVNEYVTKAYAANALPVIVAYNIPGRDCGHYSQGGSSYEGYKTWIQSLSNAIGDRKAAVILEPDALGLDCLQNDTTYSLMKHAVDTLESKPNISVYIEAASWVDPGAMSNRLTKAGIQNARGFAVNTSGYNTTDSMVAFGNAISSKTGKNFVIDTSRNGRGPYDQSQPEPWCNPPDRALGSRPTEQTGHASVDAYLWVKVPGESDGTCRGGPSAGSWWAEYALGLAQRASY